jgi:hypothetical protein
VEHGDASSRLREQKEKIDRALEAHRNDSPQLRRAEAALRDSSPSMPGFGEADGASMRSERSRSPQRRLSLRELSEEHSYAVDSEKRVREAMGPMEIYLVAARAAFVDNGLLREAAASLADARSVLEELAMKDELAGRSRVDEAAEQEDLRRASLNPFRDPLARPDETEAQQLMSRKLAPRSSLLGMGASRQHSIAPGTDLRRPTGTMQGSAAKNVTNWVEAAPTRAAEVRMRNSVIERSSPNTRRKSLGGKSSPGGAGGASTSPSRRRSCSPKAKRKPRPSGPGAELM